MKAYAISEWFEAAALGNVDELQRLWSPEVDMEAKDPKAGGTVLIEACKSGSPSCVEFLTSRGARLDATDDEGVTALMVASCNDNAPLARLLLGQGANCQAMDGRGLSALHIAAWFGSIACMRELLNVGAQIECRARDGSTPLMWAAAQGQRACVELLLSSGAKAASESDDGRPAWRWADECALPNASFSSDEAMIELRDFLRAKACSEIESAELSRAAPDTSRLNTERRSI
jgi:ankyrin repeat protein